MAEKEKLRKDIEYFTALIERHGARAPNPPNFSNTHHISDRRVGAPVSSRYSLVRNNQPKKTRDDGQALDSSRSVAANRTVVPPQSHKARTVVKSGKVLSSSRRTVLQPYHAIDRPTAVSSTSQGRGGVASQTPQYREVVAPFTSQPRLVAVPPTSQPKRVQSSFKPGVQAARFNSKPGDQATLSNFKQGGVSAQSTPKQREVTLHSTSKQKEVTAHSTSKQKEVTAQSTPKQREVAAQSTSKQRELAAHSTSKQKEVVAQPTSKTKGVATQSTAKQREVAASAVTQCRETTALSTSQHISVQRQQRYATESVGVSNAKTVSQHHSTSGKAAGIITSVKVNEQKPGIPKTARSKLQKSQFVWVNTKMFQNAGEDLAKYQTESHSALQNVVQSPEVTNTKPVDYVYKSKYKLAKANLPTMSSTPNSTGANASKPRKSLTKLTAVGKYKLVPVSSRLRVKLKASPFSHKRKASLSPYRWSQHGARKSSPYISNSGKRIISRFKIRRRSTELKKAQAQNSAAAYASPKLNQRRKLSSPYKLDRRQKAGIHSRFKIDRVSATRKPQSRMPRKLTPNRRDFRWVKNEMRAASRTFVSPYKLCRRSSISHDKSESQNETISINKDWIMRKLASRVLQKSAAVSLRAKYRKNNTNDKHCLFYMRFGKCNRGDKCYYTHDPDRIAVCTRYLRGTCTIVNCPFSHEAKKEKVPVCQHFLRGCCLRDNCPYLHVNVGKNAPICKSFAERRYCHLGEKCKKLHTDVCPDRDSDGKCAKGSKCRLRHPKRMAKRYVATGDSKTLSEDKPCADQHPAKGSEYVVPAGEKLTLALPAYISLTVSQDTDAGTPDTKDVRKLRNKPNFL